MLRRLSTLAIHAAAILCACEQGAGPTPVGSWSFDEGSGTVAADRSALAGDCTLGPTTTWTPGRSGSALLFDGTVATSCGPDPLAMASQSMSFALWTRFDALTTYNYLVETSWFHVFHRGDFTGPVLYFVALTDTYDPVGDSEWTNGAAARTTSEIVLGEWFHVIGTLDGRTLSLYIDGELEKQIACRDCFDVAAGTAADLRIGRSFVGALDEVELFPRAMTADEARDYYQARR